MAERSHAIFLIPTHLAVALKSSLETALRAELETPDAATGMTEFTLVEAVGGGFEESQELQKLRIPFLNAWHAGRDGGYEPGALVFIPHKDGAQDLVEVDVLHGGSMPAIVIDSKGHLDMEALANGRLFVACRRKLEQLALEGIPASR